MNITLRTLQIYYKENLKHKALFFGTNTLWLTGMVVQKITLPLIAASTLDVLVKSQANGNVHWGLFTPRILLFVAAALLAQALIDGGLLLLSRLETRVMPELHSRIYNMLTQRSMHFHNSSFSGALVNQTNRFVNAYVAITDVVAMNFSQLFVFIFVSSIVLFYYSPLIALTLMGWSLLFVAINVVLTIRRIPYSRARAAADSKLTGYLADSLGNVSTIKTFATEQYELNQYTQLAKDRAQKGYVYWIRTLKNDAVFGVLMVVLQVLVLLVSIHSVKNGAISIGTLILAQVYITQIIAYLWGLSNITKNIEQNLSDAAEMTVILHQPQTVTDSKAATQFAPKTGEILFNNVSFTHNESSDTLFENLSLSVKSGEKIGLVGPSGGGKTTITKLLLRLMDIQEGEILIDGQDIAKVTQESLRTAIAYVPQEPLLFHRALKENIAYGKLGATDEDIISASKKANAHEFIERLPDSYETLVGERGVKLSGGQRQRVAIARAMLKNAPILVLDEATSALDSESEVLIQDGLWKLMEGRTAIVIAHRLSTIQKMDRIVVLDKGQIIEQGSHKELLAKNGMYAQLWAHQSGGFIED